MAFWGIMAVIGALIGAQLKPRPIAPLVALGVAALARALVGVLAPLAVGGVQVSALTTTAFDIVEDRADDYLPLMGVAGASALATMGLGVLADRRGRGRQLSLDEATRVRRRVRKGRYVRAEGMVEKREAQSEAEARHKSILGL